MRARKIITLTTDFGHDSSYVGQMKGAALSILPELQLVDLCHEVPAHQIATAAYLLETGYASFPDGSIHVAVVDPGVGSARKAIALRAGAHYFLAPDNGLLSRVLEREPLHEARFIETRAFHRRPPSATFDGRDLFAPAAARLAAGLEFQLLGPAAGELVILPRRKAALLPGSPEEVAVLHVDRFGNVALDIHRDELLSALGGEPSAERTFTVETAGRRVATFRRTYGDAPVAGPFLLMNSAGYLEIAVREGRAGDALGLRPGMQVLLTIA